MEKKIENTSKFVHDERSSKEIQQDLAARGEQFSRTIEQLGERIEEKLDWRGYMRKSPFWALGTATGLGFLAAGMVRRRSTPVERLLDSLNSSVRGSLSGTARPGLVRLTLLGIAAKTATHWLNKAPSLAATSSDVEHQADPEF